jgi:hypothetical protein
MLSPDMRAALKWGGVAGAALVAEHAALWNCQGLWGGFRRPIPYTLGTATLLAAGWAWAAERDGARTLRAVTVITAVGGAATVAAYAVHALLSSPPAPPPPIVPAQPLPPLEGPTHDELFPALH